jgi:hypothetical protein
VLKVDLEEEDKEAAMVLQHKMLQQIQGVVEEVVITFQLVYRVEMVDQE